MKKQILIGLSLFLVLCLSGHGSADVRQNTGTFLMSYIDIVYAGGLEPKIERTYFSTSSFRGMFGLGWIGNYETHLTITGYGPIVLHEPEGEDHRFIPMDWASQKPGQVADLIVAEATKTGAVKNPIEASTLKSQLLRDPSVIDRYWKAYADKGLVTSKDLPLNSKLRGERFGYQQIERVADGYEHRDGFRRIQKFNEKGKLISIRDSSNSISLTLDANGKIRALQDNYGRRMAFDYNNQNLVEKIVGTSPAAPDRVASYRYNPQGEMIFSSDWNKIEYTHEYSAGKMSKIGYPKDKTTREVSYYGPEHEGKVKSEKDPEGTITSYTYTNKTDDHLIVEEVIRVPKSKSVTTNKYEYFYKNKPSGERWNWRKIDPSEGITTIVEYEDGCGCPKQIVEGKSRAIFSYDTLGRVVRKEAGTEITELKYLGNTGWVVMAKKSSLQRGGKVTIATFLYDEVRGVLKNGEVFDGTSRKWVQIGYDQHGRIEELRDSSNRIINFKYNISSKPISIKVQRIGEITVTYEPDGETIKDVDAKHLEGGNGPRTAASEVSAAFDLLTSITSIAKISFSN
jgi:hypothetical protein